MLFPKHYSTLCSPVSLFYAQNIIECFTTDPSGIVYYKNDVF